MRTGQELVTAVDRNRPPDERCFGTKLILGGAHDPQWRAALSRIEAPHVALDFAYFFKRASEPGSLDPLVEELREGLRPFRFVFLESGAEHFGRGRKNLPSIEAYRVIYTEFLTQFRDAGLWTVAGEFDLWDSPQQRAEGLLELQEAGIEIVPNIRDLSVTGPIPSEVTPEGLLTDWPLVSVSGDLVRDQAMQVKKDLAELHVMAAMRGSLLHAFSVTRQAMACGSWYSAASLTWTTGSRFGRTTVWDPAMNELRHLDLSKKDQRAAFRERFESSGLDWAKIEAEDQVEVNLANAVGWLDWADHLGRMTENAYWLTDSERLLAEGKREEAVDPDGNSQAIALAQDTALAIAEERAPMVLDERTLQPVLCNTCVIRNKCPKFEADSTCAFHMVAPVTGQDSATAALNAAITIQLQRIQQGHLIEKVNGGALSELVGEELMRLAEMVAISAKAGSKRESITVEGGPGVLQQFIEAVRGPQETRVTEVIEVREVDR